jgi:carbamoyltransferase
MSNSTEATSDQLPTKKKDASLILGISIFGHDSSCTLLDAATGKILYALTEERFSNIKHDGNFPVAAIENINERIISEQLGVINYIALNTDPVIAIKCIKSELEALLDNKTSNLIYSAFVKHLEFAEFLHPDFFPLNYISKLLERHDVPLVTIELIQGKISWFGNFALRHEKLKSHLKRVFSQADIISVGHHQCHAASAFYCSEYTRAAVLTLDGQGELAASSLSVANGTQINLLAQSNWPNSLGALYMQLAWYLGFDGDDPRYLGFGDEFKVMGMAAYGKPIYLDFFRKFGYVNELGEFEINFNNGYIDLIAVEGCNGHSQPVLANKFFETLGKRRLRDDVISQKHYDIACSGQYFLEEVAVGIARNLKTRCPDEENICIAGGVGLNGLMNMRILKEAGFRNIFIQPASGDDGTSLGAALHVYHEHLAGQRCSKLENVFLGLNYSNEAIRSELVNYKLKFYEPKNIHAEIAQFLNNGLIVARYFDRGEFGPRALGHRSILANPTLSKTKDEVNAKIKHRESFRPFAPACLANNAQEYFDISIHTPYMLLICKAKSGVRLKIPAVVHDDDTARLQMVNEEENSDLYHTISEFYRLSKIPVVLNTSFNVNGEAIVETPQDAIESFLFMGIDYLAIGPFLVSREENNFSYQRPSRENHIKSRQSRYQERYFSPERYFWSVNNPIETQLSLLNKQVGIYRKSAEERLTLINVLDSEVQRLHFHGSTVSQKRSIYSKLRAWVR